MIPLYTSEQVRQADKYAVEKLNIPSIVLMENAAINIFNSIFEVFGKFENISPIGILVGKGNNGGDALAVARHFINNRYKVKILSFCNQNDFKGDALLNFIITSKLIKTSTGSGIYFYKSIKDVSKLSSCSLIIDGLLGTGTKGNLREPFNSVISKINQFNSLKIALDVPTGLNVDTGSCENAFESDLTVTLAELKRGLFFQDGISFSGKVYKGSIGIGEEYFNQLKVEDYLIEPEDALNGLPVKKNNLHKYSAGKVFVIAGSGDLPGAAIFTTNAVMQSGSGACLLAFPKSLKELAQAKINGAVVNSFEDDKKQMLQVNNIDELEQRIKWADVVAIGPGLGRATETISAVRKILKQFTAKKMVVDADAIFALNDGEYKKYNLRNKVFTPHHKEFANLIGVELHQLESDLLKYGKEFASETKSYLILKGSPTIIFTPNREALINTVGNSGMAKFGMGDVLTGVIASFVAQTNEIESSIISAVYLHSLSADLLLQSETEFGIDAEKVSANLSNAIKFLRKSVEPIL